MEAFKMMSSFVIVVLILNKVHCKSVTHRHNSQWVEHLQRVNRFQCNNPQPRAIDVKEFINATQQSMYQKFHPHSTVLYRCGGAGCCPSHKECSAINFEDISLIVHVREISSNRNSFISITARNETKCSCQERINRPK